MTHEFTAGEIEITTDRLVAKIFGPDDVSQKYVDALNDPVVIGQTESRYRQSPQTLEGARTYAEWANSKDSLFLGIFTKDSGQHIGNIRLHTIDLANSRAELGIMIWDKTFWGKGFATEALSAVVDYAFYFLGLHKIEAEYHANNLGSKRIFAKAGFEVEGEIRDHFLVNGVFVDAIRVGKIKSP